jgi:hypothetical protein
MFRSSTIIRELVQSLAKVIFLLKQKYNLTRLCTSSVVMVEDRNM